MEDRREYENPYDEFVPHRDNSANVVQNGSIHPEFVERLKITSTSLLGRLNSSLSEAEQQDYSVYTGTTGIALLYFLLGVRQSNPLYLKRAREFIDKALPRLKQHRVSFLNGDAGPLAVGAVLYNQEGGSREHAWELINRLKGLLPQVMNLKSDLPDEVLYGRAGYLYALLFINKHIGEGTIDAETIRQVVSTILQSGQRLAQLEHRNVPLMYKWHDKHYLGAAHGIAGILYLLLKAKDYMSQTDLERLIHPTVDYMQGINFPSGNFPSSLGNNTDRLVQWCHGAPGMVDLFCLAHQVFADERYLKTALQCGDIVWSRGILRKGYSICHGVSGNAYSFLRLYQITGDLKHLHRACKFADWCLHYGKYQNRIPDRPLSLYEGLAGVIFFLNDIQQPQTAGFPGYAL